MMDKTKNRIESNNPVMGILNPRNPKQARIMGHITDVRALILSPGLNTHPCPDTIFSVYR
jgi:hypothetical protein